MNINCIHLVVFTPKGAISCVTIHNNRTSGEKCPIEAFQIVVVPASSRDTCSICIFLEGSSMVKIVLYSFPF